MTEKHDKLPLLITTHGSHLHRQSLYSLVDRRCKTIEIPIMHCKRILGSSHGWLVLVSLVTGNSFLWKLECNIDVRDRSSMLAPPGRIQPTYGVVDTDDGEYEFVTVHVVNGGVEYRPLLDELGQTLEVPIPRRTNVKWHESHLIEAPGGQGLLLVMKFFITDSVEFKVFRLKVADGRVECVELDSVDEWTIFIDYFGRGFCRISSSER
ncbi:Unknown protein [Striga hermonthica]|uniref:Uncharacterized protein n=1 Tax=Striga hermonthica TaxID=68872 RepID=A0A9N7R3X8_STRHE|nr:Unknown protein [Striga hermonthica]